MLGEKIGEEVGKIIGQRVLPGAGEVETSFRHTGTLLGVKETNLGTYHAAMRPDGTIFGEGEGVVMAKDGGVARWKGHGVGLVKPDGSISYRGSLIYSTEFSKWARLNSCAVLFEYDVDAEGNAASKVFEWK